MRPLRRLPGALAVAVVLAGAVFGTAGCDGLPDSGPIRIAHAAPLVAGAAIGVQKLPAGPQNDATPTAVVAGFLQAEGDPEGYAVARAFLAPQAAASFTGPVTIYQTPRLTQAPTRPKADTTTVTLTASVVGSIDGRGGFQPREGSLHESYRLRRLASGWRLSAVPPGLVITSDDFTYSYRALNVYFPARSGGVLVPEPVYLPASVLALPTALVRSLLSGPEPALAAGVTTGLSPGTPMDGAAVFAGGQVTVDLAVAPTSVPPAGTRQLLDQLAATLGQLASVTEVRLTAQGSALVLPGGEEAVLATGAVAGAGVDGQAFGPAVTGPVPLASTVRVVTTGGTEAAVAGGVVVERTARTRWRNLHLPGPVAALGFGPGGVLWMGGPGGLASYGGGVLTRFGGPAVSALAVAPDGVRIAVATPAGLRVDVVGPGAALASGPPVAPGLVDVTGLAWGGPDQIEALAASDGAPRQLWQVRCDGSQTAPVADRPPLPVPPVAVAAAPGEPVLLESADEIWAMNAAAQWIRLGAGVLPAYPVPGR